MRDDIGWVCPVDSRKFHYYTADRRALCGRYVLFRGGPGLPEDGPSIDDCKGCRRKVDKQRRTAETGGGE